MEKADGPVTSPAVVRPYRQWTIAQIFSEVGKLSVEYDKMKSRPMEYDDLEVYQERLSEIEETLNSLKFEVMVRVERGRKDLEGEEWRISRISVERTNSFHARLHVIVLSQKLKIVIYKNPSMYSRGMFVCGRLSHLSDFGFLPFNTERFFVFANGDMERVTFFNHAFHQSES